MTARAVRSLIVAALPALVAATPSEIAVTVHLAAGADGAPVSDDAWIADELAMAGVRLGPADVTFARTAPGATTGIPADVISVDDRDALAELADDTAVHVFVVARLADKDQDGTWINGVTWRYAGPRRELRGRRYIVLARQAALVDTLAHELGHLFGLAHTEDPTNLMMAPGRQDDAALTDEQVKIVRRRAAAWAKRITGRARTR